MPCSRAVGAQRADVVDACRARGGRRRGRPPRAPIAYGEPGSSGPAVSVLLRPLRFLHADRVDRRQVEDVEAELGDRRGAASRRAFRPPQERGNSSYQAPKRGAHAVDLDRQRLVERGRAVALGGALHRRRTARAPSADVVLGGSGVASSSAASACSISRACRRPWRAPAASLEQHDALGQLAGEVVLAGGDLALQLVAPGGEDVAPGLDRPLPAARASSTANSPSQRTPLTCASIGAHRRLDASGGRPAPR